MKNYNHETYLNMFYLLYDILLHCKHIYMLIELLSYQYNKYL